MRMRVILNLTLAHARVIVMHVTSWFIVSCVMSDMIDVIPMTPGYPYLFRLYLEHQLDHLHACAIYKLFIIHYFKVMHKLCESKLGPPRRYRVKCLDLLVEPSGEMLGPPWRHQVKCCPTNYLPSYLRQCSHIS